MLFNSFVFCCLFLPATLFLFWLLPSQTAKRHTLLISSLVFYGYFFPPYLLLVFVLVFVAWVAGMLLDQTQRMLTLFFAGLVIFGLLGFFKYASFFNQLMLDASLIDTSLRVHDLVLPLGISFISFQAYGYVVDVYRKHIPAEKSFSTLFLFKSFFPQLIAGPICRGHELLPQIKSNFVFKFRVFGSGLAIFALGLLIKEFFADSLAPLVDHLFETKEEYNFIDSWVASIGFGGQIYADFWGYSTMAVGLARMFDIEIPVNFNLPYLASSLREFWRRWHVSLSQWLRDYLYIPLGGSKHGRFRTIAALMLTMLIGGLWHGANYTFIIWGAIHGLALVFEHLLLGFKLQFKPLSIFIGWTYTFAVVSVAWVFFRAVDVNQAVEMTRAMFDLDTIQSATALVKLKQVLFLVLTLWFFQIPIEWMLRKLRSGSWSATLALMVAILSIVLAIVLGSPAPVPFIYFQF